VGACYQFNMTFTLLPAMGLLFIAVGYLLGRPSAISRGHPHALDAEQHTVWAKTHQLGKWTFVGAGAVTMCVPSGRGWTLDLTLTCWRPPLCDPLLYILWRRENPPRRSWEATHTQRTRSSRC